MKKIKREKSRVIENGTKAEPPEGGWGYAVCFGIILLFVTCFSPSSSWMLIYTDFVTSQGSGLAAISTVGGVTSFTSSTFAILTNVALKKFTIRQVGCFGALSFCMSWFLNFFITSVHEMLITSGIMVGIGIGVLPSICYTRLTQYFVKKSITVMGALKFFTGIASIFFPELIRYFLETFGFRGTLLLVGAISTHAFIGIALLHPVEWHNKKERAYKEVKQDENNIKSCIRIPLNIENAHMKEKCLNIDVGKDTKEINHEIQPQIRVDRSINELQNISKNTPIIQEENTRISENLPYRENTSIWKKIKIINTIDFDLLNERGFRILLLGMTFGIISDAIFFGLLPLNLNSRGFDKKQVTYCMTIQMIADVTGRALIAITSHYAKFKSKSLFLTGIIFTVIFRVFFTHTPYFTGSVTLIGILGFFRSFVHVPMALVYAEYSSQKFTAAYTISIGAQGIALAIFSPLIGILKDITGSYVVMFYSLIILDFICIIPWSLEYCFIKNKPTTTFIDVT